MTSILTPEEICELDTFTLEQKIEELQSHPNSSYFTDILKMAKLELIDRLQTEEFGRKLANDEFKIADEILFLPPKPIPQTQTQIKKLPASSNNRKQAVIKIQTNLISAGSFVTIGKPAVNHRYKPKIQKVEYIQPAKNYLKAKKYNVSKGKANRVTIQKEIAPKKQQVLSNKDVKTNFFSSKEAPKTNIVQEIEALSKPQEFSLKQKLKRQVQEMKVVFRQNDAYDDMRQIKLTPQNLLEQQIKMQQTEPISTEIDESESQSYEKVNQSSQANQIEKQIEEIPVFSIQRQNEDKLQFQYQQIKFTSQIQTSQKIPQQPEISIKATSKAEQNVEQFKEPKKQELVITNINLDKLNPASNFTNREAKSNSVRSLVKQTCQNYQHLMSENQRISHKTDNRVSSIKFLKEEFKIRTEHRMAKSNYGSFKPAIAKAQTYPYHQTISNFHKLFPHSKNLLLTLRNVQENLKLHFTKQVDDKSRNNEYLRLNQNDLTFKIISECQKARKYAGFFGIELDTFHKRGEIMLNRIRGEEQSTSDIMLYRVVRTKQQVYDIINSSFHRTKYWHELPHGMELRASWNLLWTWSKPQIDFSDLFYFQKVNHFIGNKQIARKDLLKKNIENIQKLGGKMKQYFDIIPQTFLLPGQNIAFIKKFRQYGLKDPLNYWILKPVGLSRGRGIELVNKLEEVVFSEPVVLQRYVSNPFLVDGFKFDMRIYVLVTSINPLEAFIYHEGFARLSTERYSLDQNLMDNKYIHLTNFSINRENIADRKLTLEQQLGGCKISLKMLKKRLEQSGVVWEKVEKQIQQIVLKSLIACMNTIPQNPNCFQLFGYDIFMDSNLKCWLLEVNSSPSLQKQFMLDEVIKQQLVDDIMEIVCPVSYNRERLLQIVERRRKEAEGLKSSINVATNSAWQLDQDLHYILNGQKLRKYGQATHKNFKVVAPSQKYYSIVKVLQQYKIDPIIKQEK